MDGCTDTCPIIMNKWFETEKYNVIQIIYLKINLIQNYTFYHINMFVLKYKMLVLIKIKQIQNNAIYTIGQRLGDI